jgi:hypothetical protein
MTASRWVRRWSEPAGTDEPVAADPDHAWKALTLANEWLRHAETKLGTTLAAAGVTGGVLFNLVRTRGDGTALYNVSAVVCFLGVIVAGLLAVIGLFPRLRLTLRRTRNGDSPINPLFFHDVANAFRGMRPVIPKYYTPSQPILATSYATLRTRSMRTRWLPNGSIDGQTERHALSLCRSSGSPPWPDRLR